MQAGTPNMHHATPVMGASTPASRMTHASPSNTMVQTPVMAPNTIAAQHITLSHPQMTPEQIRRVQQQQEQQKLAQRQRAQLEHQQMAHQIQNSPPGPISPERMQMYHHQHPQQRLVQQVAYQDNVRKQQHQQMNGHISSPYPGQPPQPHPGQQQHQAQQPQLHAGGQPRPTMSSQLQMQQHFNQLQKTFYATQMQRIQQSMGGEIPHDKRHQAHSHAMTLAQNMARQALAKQQQDAVEHRRLMMQAQMGGMAGVNGMGGGMQMGVNGGGQVPNGAMGGLNMNGMNGMGMNGMGMQ